MGYYDFITSGGGTVDWKGGDGYGIGLIAEYAWNNYIALQSGIWYEVSYIDLRMEGSETIEARTEHWVIPFYVIASYSFDRFSVGVLAGLSFMHIRKSEFNGNMGNYSNIEVTQYLNYDMYGAAGGVQCKIGITRFIDVFAQGIAEIYANRFITKTQGTSEFLYDFRAVIGVMAKTY
jgi:hypothetical protein